jgi:hypothetical protein
MSERLKMTINPWLTLPEVAPFALATDLERVVAFNRSASYDSIVHLELLPEPFIGNFLAPVVVLALNPGFSPDDPKTHQDERFIEFSRRNLKNENTEYPFFFLNPSINAPGRTWWEQKLSRLIRAKGQETVAQKVLCIEFFPYHSRRFDYAKLNVPSQDFSMELVRKAMSRDALIIILRGAKLWFRALPELATYKRMYRVRNPQNVILTSTNCPEGYDIILGEI